MTTVVKADRIVAAEVLVTSPGRNYVTLKITTAEGLTGWGDATLNGRELAVAAYLRDHVCPLLIGRDPARIEDTWQYLYRGVYWRRGPVTMTSVGAVDLALWDIKGKAAGQPVYQLLGGAVRDRILSYTHATGWDVPALLDSIDAARERGFQAIRAQSGVPGLDTVYGVSRAGAAYEPAGRGTAPTEEVWDTDAYLRHAPVALAAAREHVGPEVALLHDVHHRLNPNQAARLGKALEPLDLFWLEDVTPAENQEVLRHVRRHTTVPLAIGEVFTTIWEFQQLITEQLIDFVRAAVTTPAASATCAASPRSRRSGRSASARTARPTSPRWPSRRRCTSAWPRRTSRSRSTWATRTPRTRCSTTHGTTPTGTSTRATRPASASTSTRPWPPGSPTNPPTCPSRAAPTAP